MPKTALALQQLDKLSDDGNVARRLNHMAAQHPTAVAVVVPGGYRHGQRQYTTCTFAELNDDSSRLASGLTTLGIKPGMRIALLVKPGREFITLVFALLKLGAVIVLIDPGMGRRNLLGCLAEAEPDGFVAIPLVHRLRRVFRRRFPKSKFHVTTGRRASGDCVTLDDVRRRGTSDAAIFEAAVEDPAAIIFTTGSTGPPKGVLYTHGNFDQQVRVLADVYGIEPGGVDLAGFPLFGLFNAALGMTTLVPEMDFTRPAKADPRKIVEAIHDWQVTQAFGSPALWRRVGEYCVQQRVRLPSLRRVFSAGAPVPPGVLAQMKDCIAADGEVYTPYGATEALPVASISASEVLGETQARWAAGGGTCVGRAVGEIQWRVIEISDGPIATIDLARTLPTGQIGELIVSGPVVTQKYVTRTEWNARAKIADGARVWHRMGDVGYLDAAGRFWFCGRMAHRVQTATGTLFTIPCEAIFNQHPAVFRSALVGVGPSGNQRPVIIVEPRPGFVPRLGGKRRALLTELAELASAHEHTREIHDFLIHRAMPVDIRHNAKIFREKLAVWAARKLR